MERLIQEHEPFGSLLPGRNYSSDSYAHGFNGMRKDDEIHGATGTSYDFGARLYDPRVGRWLSIDPLFKQYVPISPYAFSLNSPISLMDKDGRVVVDQYGNPVTIKVKKGKDGTYTATFKFHKGLQDFDKEEFMKNGGRVVEAMIQTQTGRKTLRRVINSASNVHYNVTEEPFVVTNPSGEKGMAYGVTQPSPTSDVDNFGNFTDLEVTISIGSFEFGKTEEGRQISKDPTRLYTGDVGEFMNGVGTHESVHAIEDGAVMAKLRRKGIMDKEGNVVPGREDDYNKFIERRPNLIEDKSRQEYNQKPTTP